MREKFNYFICCRVVNNARDLVDSMIRYATINDLLVLKKYDRHIMEAELRDSLNKNRIIVMENDGVFMGWLRFNLFWDNTPFINMLYILDSFQGRGCGGQLLAFFEKEMRENGHCLILTSTLSNERAQFFYRKHGFSDCGSLILPGQPLEIILLKNLV